MNEAYGPHGGADPPLRERAGRRGRHRDVMGGEALWGSARRMFGNGMHAPAGPDGTVGLAAARVGVWDTFA
jgi:hypothetical protein